jgi:large subunit ribosomal protein L30
MAGRLRVTLIKSPISHTQRTRGTVRALGLHRLGETVEVADTPEMRGMTRAVRFLLQTEEIDGQAATTEASAEPAVEPAAGDSPSDEPARTPRRRSRKEESQS